MTLSKNVYVIEILNEYHVSL